MRVFITGGTGFIGARLTEKLISENHIVTLLVRNPSVPESPGEGITFIRGDILIKQPLERGWIM
jgi:nucleoside-diphosphate-sugar epimerase